MSEQVCPAEQDVAEGSISGFEGRSGELQVVDREWFSRRQIA